MARRFFPLFFSTSIDGATRDLAVSRGEQFPRSHPTLRTFLAFALPRLLPGCLPRDPREHIHCSSSAASASSLSFSDSPSAPAESLYAPSALTRVSGPSSSTFLHVPAHAVGASLTAPQWQAWMADWQTATRRVLGDRDADPTSRALPTVSSRLLVPFCAYLLRLQRRSADQTLRGSRAKPAEREIKEENKKEENKKEENKKENEEQTRKVEGNCGEEQECCEGPSERVKRLCVESRESWGKVSSPSSSAASCQASLCLELQDAFRLLFLLRLLLSRVDHPGSEGTLSLPDRLASVRLYCEGVLGLLYTLQTRMLPQWLSCECMKSACASEELSAGSTNQFRSPAPVLPTPVRLLLLLLQAHFPLLQRTALFAEISGDSEPSRLVDGEGDFETRKLVAKVFAKTAQLVHRVQMRERRRRTACTSASGERESSVEGEVSSSCLVARPSGYLVDMLRYFRGFLEGGDSSSFSRGKETEDGFQDDASVPAVCSSLPDLAAALLSPEERDGVSEELRLIFEIPDAAQNATRGAPEALGSLFALGELFAVARRSSLDSRNREKEARETGEKKSDERKETVKGKDGATSSDRGHREEERPSKTRNVEDVSSGVYPEEIRACVRVVVRHVLRWGAAYSGQAVERMIGIEGKEKRLLKAFGEKMKTPGSDKVLERYAAELLSGSLSALADICMRRTSAVACVLVEMQEAGEEQTDGPNASLRQETKEQNKKEEKALQHLVSFLDAVARHALAVSVDEATGDLRPLSSTHTPKN
ncbi:HEAT repeat-containing protein [Toxoplasma gondii p89]|uniref:HEAT repeat-containing protein n=2 Tax=Toxoplasma gondii TaxID=5811 RepID=A0A2T6IFI5_TOXGO|nr:HEAT repeat-containing protein [Toxoplasma gondii p89]PUA84101.1 HEAT repeat-containing protein [Toxoplasma gondii TgCATBr9]